MSDATRTSKEQVNAQAEQLRAIAKAIYNQNAFRAGQIDDIADELEYQQRHAHEPGTPRKCHANMHSDPPQDCDAPFCGCNPAWDDCIQMLQECGLLIDRNAPRTTEPPAACHCDEARTVLRSMKNEHIERGSLSGRMQREAESLLQKLDARAAETKSEQDTADKVMAAVRQHFGRTAENSEMAGGKGADETTAATEPVRRPASPPMAMLPNDHHPGPRCSCRGCLRRFPEEVDAAETLPAPAQTRPAHKPGCAKEQARIDGADRWYMLTCECESENGSEG